MGVRDDGLFRPLEPVTRNEAFTLLVALIDGLSDLADDDPLAALYEARLIGQGEADAVLNREELADFLNDLSHRLTGEEQQRALALSESVTDGVLAENDGASGEPDTVTRGELAQVLVTLAGRTPDEDSLFFRETLPPDVKKGDWAWAYIADAVTRGEPAPAEQGLYRIQDWLYAAGEDGTILTDQAYSVWYFGPDGAYTTGDETLDGYLADALKASGANALEGQDALAAVYMWIKENFEYLVTPEDMTPEEVGSTGWEYDRALRFFKNGGGTCYGYAAAFGLMARCLGEQAHIVAATVNQYNGDHSFVVIPEDGVDWIYDVELEDARSQRHTDMELFHIENHTVYNYWYTPAW